ncbi:hypothetical protein AVEN_47848-1 [Araneus ventricosus]|uniref:CCHC-type domain-containing protein n=1 Tax=Araneus ventricosus TaxID=182803 RepID=A0A4Y2BIH4_ARAVE|nr:hypothetical protein AVEN_47848-1 [Araneus ventricosus]
MPGPSFPILECKSESSVTAASPCNKPLSYAETARNTILLYPKEGNKETSLRKLLQKEVDPLEEKIKFKEIRSIRNKGLAIDFATDEQAERLIKKLERKEELQAAVEARKFEKRNPRCIIYDVPTATSDESVLKATEAATSFEASNFTISFRTRDRGDKSHCVIQAKSEAFTTLMSCKKLAIGWSRHSVKEHLNIKRCCRCQSYGHLQKDCRRKNFYCALYGFEHHNKACHSRAPCCANCWEESTKRGTGFRVDYPADSN